MLCHGDRGGSSEWTCSNVSLDEGVCVIIIVVFPVPAPFTAATSISSATSILY